jgi:hypothetical protein
MLSQILCSIFLICADVQSPAINILSADDGLPRWAQTEVHAVPIIQRWEGTGPVRSCSSVRARYVLRGLPRHHR